VASRLGGREREGEGVRVAADPYSDSQRLQERGWFAATETLLALTIFKDDFESTFVALCVGLLFLKVFHWLASDRVEMVCRCLSLVLLVTDS
jgi:hypothetical protein